MFELTNNQTQASRQIIGCLGDCTVVQGKKLGLHGYIKSPDSCWAFPYESDDIDFMPSADYLAMMENLRNTILATPDQVETLKSDFNPNSLI